MANEAKYVVELTSEERSQIKRMLSKGKAAAYKQRHGRILLLTDQGSHGGKKMSDVAIAQALACGQATVERIRKRFVLEGFEVALVEREAEPGGVARKIRHAINGHDPQELVAELVDRTRRAGEAAGFGG